MAAACFASLVFGAMIASSSGQRDQNIYVKSVSMVNGVLMMLASHVLKVLDASGKLDPPRKCRNEALGSLSFLSALVSLYNDKVR